MSFPLSQVDSLHFFANAELDSGLEHLVPDFVRVPFDGTIVETDGLDLAKRLDEVGFDGRKHAGAGSL